VQIPYRHWLWFQQIAHHAKDRGRDQVIHILLIANLTDTGGRRATIPFGATNAVQNF
jgi:hypothetical protein